MKENILFTRSYLNLLKQIGRFLNKHSSNKFSFKLDINEFYSLICLQYGTFIVSEYMLGTNLVAIFYKFNNNIFEKLQNIINDNKAHRNSKIRAMSLRDDLIFLCE